MHKSEKGPARNDVSQVSSHLTQNAAAISRVAGWICGGGAECDPSSPESEAMGDATKRADVVVRNIS